MSVLFGCCTPVSPRYSWIFISLPVIEKKGESKEKEKEKRILLFYDKPYRVDSTVT